MAKKRRRGRGFGRWGGGELTRGKLAVDLGKNILIYDASIFIHAWSGDTLGRVCRPFFCFAVFVFFVLAVDGFGYTPDDPGRHSPRSPRKRHLAERDVPQLCVTPPPPGPPPVVIAYAGGGEGGGGGGCVSNTVKVVSEPRKYEKLDVTRGGFDGMFSFLRRGRRPSALL